MKEGIPVPNRVIDPTGVTLRPGQPGKCKGNGSATDENGLPILCCDECDYFLLCFDEHGEPRREAQQP